MAGTKLSPRQKMINMMYLVLIALLALNVSKEVLDAFVLINQGLVRTTTNFSDKNDKVYANFESAAASAPKARQWKRKAFEVRDHANAIVGYLEDLKVELVIKVEGLDPGDREIAIEKMKTKEGVENKADTDIPATMMINNKKGAQLRKELVKFREFMVGMVKPKDTQFKDAIQAALATDDPIPLGDNPQISWESEFFEHLPAIAVICNMSQMQSSIRNAEAEIIGYLEKEIEGEAMKFNKVEAIVIPEKTYVTRGDTFRADIFLAASDSLTAPTVTIGKVDTVGPGQYIMHGESDSLRIEAGKGKLKIPGITTGEFVYEGIVHQKTTTGEKLYAFKAGYTIAEPSINVSPDKMNVFYIGPDNPVTVSVSGFSAKQIKPALSGGRGSIRSAGKPSKYIVTVQKQGLCYISVQAEIAPGKWKSMGKKEFRVKRTPPPVASFMKVEGEGALTPGRLKVAQGLMAKMVNFDFELKFKVTSFDLSVDVGGGVYQTISSKNNRLTPKMKQYLKRAKKGQRIIFENVKAKSPKTPIEKIPGISIKVK
ncbi:MAG TPA: gliding motility protein GldM [Flavobacteriales bacterium]|nr:gliding motility protein GldM [Flavobacteriales bacterium]